MLPAYICMCACAQEQLGMLCMHVYIYIYYSCIYVCMYTRMHAGIYGFYVFMYVCVHTQNMQMHTNAWVCNLSLSGRHGLALSCGSLCLITYTIPLVKSSFSREIPGRTQALLLWNHFKKSPPYRPYWLRCVWGSNRAHQQYRSVRLPSALWFDQSPAEHLGKICEPGVDHGVEKAVFWQV